MPVLELIMLILRLGSHTFEYSSFVFLFYDLNMFAYDKFEKIE